MASNVYNVILLGETGTGKSLFINSFANYIKFKSLKEAIESEEKVSLIPSTFKVTDCNDIELIITSGQNDRNERTEVAKSMTVNCKSYEFQIEDVFVKLIDTPGMRDTEGEDADRAHIENILSSIKKFDYLHAIAIVVNNTQTKMTDRFSYCLKLLISIVNKTTVGNIIFIQTFAKCNEFKPGPVKDVIEKFLEKKIKNLFLKLDKDHMYCFDNLSYERLIATQLGIKFDQDEFDSQNFNWRRSSAEMRRLLKHVTGLSLLQNDQAAVKMRKTVQKLEGDNNKMKTKTNNSQYRYKDYNILLLGVSGDGRSLFINSFANYFQFDSLREAIESKKPVSLIPSKFKVTDVNDKDHVITSGENDGNERIQLSESSTVSCESYKFLLGDVSVRLIDTPGVGDTNRGEADKRNVANILNFINNFYNLHAIGIVMSNFQTKLTDRLNDCLKTLLSNLNKSAVDNIVFLLTYSGGNNFKPGPVTDVIRKFNNNELKDSPLKLVKDRMYCLDNKCYEFLMATQHGVQFDQDDIDSQDYNWQRSTVEMKRLLKHVSGLTPHKVRDTVSLNDARQFFKIVRPFLTEILKNIDFKTELLNEYTSKIAAQDDAIKNAKSDPQLKQYELITTELEKPNTICKSDLCRKIVKVKGEYKILYPQICCNGCNGSNGSLRWCREMKFFGGCKQCGCSISEHERRYVKTEHVPTRWLNEEGDRRIKDANERKDALKKEVDEIEKNKMALQNEMRVIEDAEKKFAKFLKTNAICAPPDKDNFTYTAEQEATMKYEREIDKMKEVSIEEVDKLKAALTNLPLYGNLIKTVVQKNSERATRFFVNDKNILLCKRTFDSIVNSQ